MVFIFYSRYATWSSLVFYHIHKWNYGPERKQNTEWVNESCSMNKMTTWKKNESSLNMIDGRQGWHYLKNLILPLSPSPPFCSPLVFSQLWVFYKLFFLIFHPFQEKKPSLHLHMSLSSKTWPLTGKWMTATDYLAQYMMLLRSIKVYSILSRKATRKTGGGRS